MTDLEKIKKVFDEINLEYNLRIKDNFDYCENEFGERGFVCADMYITDKRVLYNPHNPCAFLFNNDTGKLIAIETVWLFMRTYCNDIRGLRSKYIGDSPPLSVNY